MFRNRIDVMGKLLCVVGGLTMFFGIVDILLTADTREITLPDSQENNQEFGLPIAFFASGAAVFALGLMISLARNAARGQEALEAQNPQLRLD